MKKAMTILLTFIMVLQLIPIPAYPALKYWNFVTTAGVVRTSSVPR